MANRIPTASRILDLGAGTGLLMLMLAQKTSGEILGIELDNEAFSQLQENLDASPWSTRLTASKGDIRRFQSDRHFDFIISNPPFFQDDLKSEQAGRNTAMHSTDLSLPELLEAIDRHLSDQGSFGIMLPTHRTEYFHSLATRKGYHCTEKLTVKHSRNHRPFRDIMHYSRSPVGLKESELIIRNEEGHYTDEFIELLKDYYLIF